MNARDQSLISIEIHIQYLGVLSHFIMKIHDLISRESWLKGFQFNLKVDTMKFRESFKNQISPDLASTKARSNTVVLVSVYYDEYDVPLPLQATTKANNSHYNPRNQIHPHLNIED